MILAALLLLILSMVLVLVSAIKGPTTYDRILSANAFGSLTVALVCLLALQDEEWSFLDIALIYTLINFIGSIAFLVYFRYQRFDAVTDDEDSL